MESATQSAPVSKGMLWAGRIISALPVLLMVFFGAFGLLQRAAVAPGFAHYGYPETVLVPICIVEIACAIIYAIPQTSVFGAILLTGYLGGATATHVRVGEPFYIPIIVGVLVWLGLYLREARLRALVPLRSPRPAAPIL